MKLHPRVTRSVVELVKRFEGLRRRAARLPDGGWTVGYGHTRSAREGAVVSPEDADALLYYDLSEVAEKVEAWTFTPLNQNQFEALTAFAFNIGAENFRRSTVLKRVNEGQYLMAAAALELWRKADFGGEDLVIDALVRRRAAEKAHFLTPPEGFRPSPTPVLKPTFDHSVIEAAANARLGRSATVVDAPLEGDDATPTVEHLANDTQADEAPSILPPVATIASAGVVTARLHQLFPEKAEPDDIMPPAPFALDNEEAQDEPEASVATNDDAPQEPARPEAATTADLTALDLPPSPKSPSPSPSPFSPFGGFGGFTPPPARASSTEASAVPVAVPPAFDAPPFDPPQAPQWSTPAPPPEAVPQDPPSLDSAPLFDAPSPRVPFAVPEGARPMRLRDDEAAAAASEDHSDAVEIVNGHAPEPPHNRSMIYFSIGLLGVALFAAALFSMFSGKASPVNLVVGLMGILLMTPAGGYFLLRFLNQRDGLVEA